MAFENLAIEPLNTALGLQSSLETTEINSTYSTFTVALLTIATLSILGCLFNIIVTLLLKLHHNVLGRMMICLSANDALFTLCFAYTHVTPPSMFINGFTLSVYAGSISWITCFAHALHHSVKHGEDYLNNAVLKKYIISSITVPVIVGSFIAIHIQAKLGNTFLILPLFSTTVLPMASMIYCGFCYVFVLKVFRRYEIKTHSELLFYPILLIICELPFVIAQLHVLFTNDLSPKSYDEVVGLVLVSRGFCNSLAYGLSSKLKQGFKTLCKRSSRGTPKEKLLESVIASSTYNYAINGNDASSKPPNYILRSSAME